MVIAQLEDTSAMDAGNLFVAPPAKSMQRRTNQQLKWQTVVAGGGGASIVTASTGEAGEGSDSVVMLLTTALHSNDKQKLTSVLNSCSTRTLRCTVDAMAELNLPLLLRTLVRRICSSSESNSTLCDWLECILYTHGAALDRLCNMATELAPLQMYAKGRLHYGEQLAALSDSVARLDRADGAAIVNDQEGDRVPNCVLDLRRRRDASMSDGDDGTSIGSASAELSDDGQEEGEEETDEDSASTTSGELSSIESLTALAEGEDDSDEGEGMLVGDDDDDL